MPFERVRDGSALAFGQRLIVIGSGLELAERLEANIAGEGRFACGVALARCRLQSNPRASAGQQKEWQQELTR